MLLETMYSHTHIIVCQSTITIVTHVIVLCLIVVIQSSIICI